MTPRVFGIVVKAHAEVLRREHRGRAWQAWHTAALPRMKRFPALEKLLGIGRTAQAQTPDEMRANLMRLFK